MKKYIFVVCAILWCSILSAGIPDKPQPVRFVNDYAQILGAQSYSLEQYLTDVHQTTGLQIVVVTIDDLEDYKVSDYAQRLGQKWGVGDAKTNSGVVILIKPRNSFGGGAVAISTGYGAEGALTDVMCGHIIDEYMMPHLQNRDYLSAAKAAAEQCVQRLSNEYGDSIKPSTSTSQLAFQTDEFDFNTYLYLLGLVLVAAIIIIPIARKKGKNEKLLNAISNAKSVEARDIAIKNAQSQKIKQSQIDEAVAEIPNRMYDRLENSASPVLFATMATAALSLGANQSRIDEIKSSMKSKTLKAVGASQSKNALNKNTKRALAWGNSQVEVSAAEAKALAIIATLAAAAATAAAAKAIKEKMTDHDSNPDNMPSSSQMSSSSQMPTSSFGGGKFSGGGASRSF